MSKKNKNLVIFDNDGVLIDSEKLAARTNAELLTKLGYPMTPAECETRFTGMSDKAMVALLQADGYALPADFIEQMYASSKDAFETELEPVYGVKAVVQRVFASGFKAAVASNAPRSNLIKNLQTTGYSDILHPEMCFSGHEVAQPKPAPDLHQHILYRYDRLAAQAIKGRNAFARRRGGSSASNGGAAPAPSAWRSTRAGRQRVRLVSACRQPIGATRRLSSCLAKYSCAFL